MTVTLDEFLKNDLDRLWVQHDEFESMYVRKGRRFLRLPHETNGQYYENVLDIANVTAKTPGTGAFSRLIDYLDKTWDGAIYIQSVLSGDFAAKLLRLGFTPLADGGDAMFNHPFNFVRNIHKSKIVKKLYNTTA